MKRLRLLILLLVFMTVPLCAFAKDDLSEGNGDLSLEVFLMTQSMDELIGLLKQDRTQTERDAVLQKLEIAVNYLNFRSRRIENKERSLDKVKQRRDRLQNQVAKIEENPEQWKPTSKKNDSYELPPLSYESPAEHRLKTLNKRIEKLDKDIEGLEEEIMALSMELVELEDFVQENLELIH